MPANSSRNQGVSESKHGQKRSKDLLHPKMHHFRPGFSQKSTDSPASTMLLLLTYSAPTEKSHQRHLSSVSSSHFCEIHVKLLPCCCFADSLLLKITLLVSLSSEQHTPTLLLENTKHQRTEIFSQMPKPVEPVIPNSQQFPAISQNTHCSAPFYTTPVHQNGFKM